MKLVRDRIPELAAANGHPGTYHQADPAEYARRLRDKLLEEAHEAATASPAALVEELGDVLQVLYALAELAGCGGGRGRVRPGPQGPHSWCLHPPPGLAAAP
jgi:predicted house-cleaning noncanonical NTP pyrophosphatase (MazG superfamily)